MDELVTLLADLINWNSFVIFSLLGLITIALSGLIIGGVWALIKVMRDLDGIKKHLSGEVLMGVTNYKELKEHKGHKIVCVSYGNDNISIECEDCKEVLMDFDKNGTTD